MRLENTTHQGKNWRVDTLADDFELLDVWEYQIRGPRDGFGTFIDIVQRSHDGAWTSKGAVGALFRLRAFLGAVLGWDKGVNQIPIPGCQESSLRERLSPEEKASQEWAQGNEEPTSDFRIVYRDEREFIAEISNGTIHAIMQHVWVPTDDGQAVPRMAVYVKHRGAFSRMYMSLINPFRYYFVYPWLLRRMERAWDRRGGALLNLGACAADNGPPFMR